MSLAYASGEEGGILLHVVHMQTTSITAFVAPRKRGGGSQHPVFTTKEKKAIVFLIII